MSVVLLAHIAKLNV